MTDADLKYVATLPQIEVLKLDGQPRITDAGLKELTGLKHLKDLGWGSTRGDRRWPQTCDLRTRG